MICRIMKIDALGNFPCLVFTDQDPNNPSQEIFMYVGNPTICPRDERLGYVFTNAKIVSDFIISPGDLGFCAMQNGAEGISIVGEVQSKDVNKIIASLARNDIKLSSKLISILNSFVTTGVVPQIEKLQKTSSKFLDNYEFLMNA